MQEADNLEEGEVNINLSERIDGEWKGTVLLGNRKGQQSNFNLNLTLQPRQLVHRNVPNYLEFNIGDGRSNSRTEGIMERMALKSQLPAQMVPIVREWLRD